MKPTDDIAPLIDVAEREFDRLTRDAYDSLTALHGFWTRLYGPNEALTVAFDALTEMDNEFHQAEALTQ